MERNYGAEIDALRNELSEIKELILAFATPKEKPDELQKPSGRIHKMKNMHPNPSIMNILHSLENICV